MDDDLRGDYSTTPAVIVMSGRAAETGNDLDDLDAATCEDKLPPLPVTRPRSAHTEKEPIASPHLPVTSGPLR
ncbi:hypothetical protein ACFWHL_25250 [Streptomyces massasporeus]